MRKQTKIYIFLLLVLTVFFFVGVTTQEYNLASGGILEKPSAEHILGTDVIGVDIYAYYFRYWCPRE